MGLMIRTLASGRTVVKIMLALKKKKKKNFHLNPHLPWEVQSPIARRIRQVRAAGVGKWPVTCFSKSALRYHRSAVLSPKAATVAPFCLRNRDRLSHADPLHSPGFLRDPTTNVYSRFISSFLFCWLSSAGSTTRDPHGAAVSLGALWQFTASPCDSGYGLQLGLWSREF